MNEEEQEQAFWDWLENASISEIQEHMTSDALEKLVDDAIEDKASYGDFKETDFVGTPWIPK